jgi:hypothetical protein
MSDVVKFAEGGAYIGTSVLDAKRKKVFQAISRKRDEVRFGRVADVVTGVVRAFDDVETASVKDPDGHDYFMSARAAVDVGEAFEVVEMCGGGRR